MPSNTTILISIVALMFTVFQGVMVLRRNHTIDSKKDANEMTTVIVKLENIGNMVSDIKNEMNNVKESLKEDRERIIALEIKLNELSIKMGGNQNGYGFNQISTK
jgi:peptidoglycan hydrolase CwlO-like protein